MRLVAAIAEVRRGHRGGSTALSLGRVDTLARRKCSAVNTEEAHDAPFLVRPCPARPRRSRGLRRRSLSGQAQNHDLPFSIGDTVTF